MNLFVVCVVGIIVTIIPSAILFVIAIKKNSIVPAIFSAYAIGTAAIFGFGIIYLLVR